MVGWGISRLRSIVWFWMQKWRSLWWWSGDCKNEQFLEGNWQLSAFVKENIEIDSSEPLRVPLLTLKLEDKNLGGRDGCNALFGSIEDFDQTMLKFGALGGTKKYCGGDFYDRIFVANLVATRHYIATADKLILLDESGRNLLEFVRIDK